MEPAAMSDFQNQIVGVVGRKGSGKSTRCRTLVRYAPRVLAWDPMADFIDVLPDSFVGVDDDLYDYFNEVSAEHLRTFACSVVPDDDLENQFELICELAYDYGSMLLVVEEAPLVCRSNYLPPMFGKIVRTGRHRGLDLLWTAQRAGEVSRALTSATDFWIFHSQTEPRDLDAIAERCGREIADKVAGLGLHNSFCWDVIQRKIIPHSPRLLKREIVRAREQTDDQPCVKTDPGSLWPSKS